MKDSGQQYFIQYLDSSDSSSSTDSRAQAAFVVAVICDGHPRGQSLAAGAGLLGVCLTHLRHSLASLTADDPAPLLFIKWLCLCLGKLCQDMPEVLLLLFLGAYFSHRTCCMSATRLLSLPALPIHLHILIPGSLTQGLKLR